MNLRRFVTTTIVALSLGGSMASPASAASPEDAVAAEVTNSLDMANASAAFSTYSAEHSTAYVNFISTGGSAPNVSCTLPTVTGRELIKHNDLIVTENHQTDFAAAAASCVNLSGGSFTMSVFIRIDYCKTRTSLTTCTFASTGFTDTTTMAAVAGTGTAVAEVDLTAIYPDLHDAVAKIRRVYACVRTSLTGTACQTYNYSGTYGH